MLCENKLALPSFRQRANAHDTCCALVCIPKHQAVGYAKKRSVVCRFVCRNSFYHQHLQGGFMNRMLWMSVSHLQLVKTLRLRVIKGVDGRIFSKGWISNIWSKRKFYIQIYVNCFSATKSNDQLMVVVLLYLLDSKIVIQIVYIPLFLNMLNC